VPTTPTIVGLSALTSDVKRLSAPGGTLDHALSQAGSAAMEPVAAQTRSSYPRQSGRLAGSVKIASEPYGASITVGGADVPWAGPVDFGGYPGDRAYIAGGRYLFPAAEQLNAKALDVYSAATQRALDGFAWTNETTSAEAVHD
jgi:hypothetical protein